jgi:hypothetical protein
MIVLFDEDVKVSAITLILIPAARRHADASATVSPP